jgi:hypothetical protein
MIAGVAQAVGARGADAARHRTLRVVQGDTQ